MTTPETEPAPASAEAGFVVTFDRRRPAGPKAVTGLRRMTLTEARDLVALAGRIPKRGKILRASDLSTVQ
ncbi:hypothetical protein AB0G48_20925 [Streptomyces rubiginosohelvolus]|uniref:hypothetical protein n=1 Tax=Streptomyces rubiginosohelvolus TaxID=67362 RepID=UPI0033C0E02B